MASSSSSVSSPTKYDVFISFRGEDTRDNFTSHLYEAFCRKKIETYIDERLNRGDDISKTLMKTIKESKIYLIIFSKDYVSSPWCLHELVKVLECKEKYGRRVMPVFCYVDPFIVRHQLESYADAFAKHEIRFKNNMAKVKRWKVALTAAANLSGWDSNKIRPESTLIKKIVEDVSKELKHLSFFTSDQFNGLIGIEKHIAVIESLLDIHTEYLNDVRFVGIWGIGGIGKTTLAEALFHKHANKFSSSVFIPNVQEEIDRNGVRKTQSKYFSKILEDEESHGDTYWRPSYLKDRLQRARVLLVLDNVNKAWQIKDLIGGHDWFGSGSRIILTTRDMQVLKNAEVDKIYEVKGMKSPDALKLFCMNAFKQDYPKDDCKKFSATMVHYSGGVPLALKVLGSSLFQKNKQEWKSAVRKLAKAPNMEIFNVLKLSYDGLDEEQKDIFLDIACLYRGQDMISVKQTLDACGFSADIGISILIDRGLIYVLNDKVMMHDLMEQMGHEIVCKQSLRDPGMRSRLWKHQDIYLLLKRKTGTEAVQCIYLDLCRIKEIDLDPSIFKRMHNLRMLQFHKSNPWEHSKVYASEGLRYLPDELRFLRWDECPLKDFPTKFYPENLINLDMPESHLKKLWRKKQHLPNLKRINLRGSQQLTTIPDLSQVPNIEEIILSRCTSLIEVSSSSLLSKLNCLWLDGCIRLKRVKLISNALSSCSGFVVLNGCRDLEEFLISKKSVNLLSDVKPTPALSGEVAEWDFTEFILCLLMLPSYRYNREEQELMEYAIPHETDRMNLLTLSPSTPNLKELCFLDLSHCDSLTYFSDCMLELGALRTLYVPYCSKLKGLPQISKPMENLKILILDESAIEELPSNLGYLAGLEELSLLRCRSLRYIPETIGSVRNLSKLDLAYCESLEVLPSSIFKLRITRLDLRHCSMLEKFPEVLEVNESLTHLCLIRTAIKEIPSSLVNLIGLQNLCLVQCRELECVAENICDMQSHLKELSLAGCRSLLKIPTNIGQLTLISELSLRGCISIVSLPTSIAHLLRLKILDLSDCWSLQTLPELPPFLQQLLAYDCLSIKEVSSSRFKISQDSEVNKFEFQLTNCLELKPIGVSNIVADVQRRLFEDPYASAFFCFPGNEIPYWFTYQVIGSRIYTEFSSSWSSHNFFGFAVCVVVASSSHQSLDEYNITYQFSFCEVDTAGHKFPVEQLMYHRNWKGQGRYLEQDHMFLWNYNIRKLGKRSRAGSGLFKFSIKHADIMAVKACGLYPIYTN